MHAAAGGLALLLVLTAVIHRPSYAVQAAAGYAPYPDITGRVVTVTAGEQYAAGPLQRALLGEHYRDLWTTPVQVPLLDLESYAGGLTPEELGGGRQTRSLKLKSADGREFAFRPVDKDPSEALAPAYRGTVVDRLVQDATSAANPAGPMIAAALLDAVGVLNARPQLFVMADQDGLGEFRDAFNGTLGYLEERPEKGFAGSGEVVEWDELLERLTKNTSHRVDVEEFLRARLVDHLLGDWDRHRDQWRWAGFKAGRRTIWRPIPRDRDQALVRYDGALLEIARKVHPKLVNFGPEYPSVLGLAWNAQELDRRLLASLNGERFQAVAESVRLAVTDSVIESAIDRVPAAYRRVRGAWLAEALRQRRDALPAHAEDLYRMLAQEVDVTGSDGTDIVVARRDSLGRLDLVVTSATGVDTLFERTFEPGETGSVRVLTGRGQDIVRLYGASGEGPLLEIEQEPRADTVIADEATRRYRLYLPRPPTARAKGDSTASQQAPRDWGSSFGISPRVEYDADLGLILGAQVARTDYAFSRTPYGSWVRLTTVYATAADGLRTELIADVRRVNPKLRLELRAQASEIEVVRFAGYGNETPTPTPDGSGFHDVDQWQFLLAPTVAYASSSRLQLYGGPIVKYSTTDLHGDHLIAQARPLGSAGFGRIGMQAGVTASTSDTANFDEAEGELVLNGSLYPPIWSPEATFGTFAVEAAGRVPIPLGPTPVVAGRLGAQRVWGAFPYDEAAFLGGQRSLRGYEYQRFAGDAMLYGSVEVRVHIAEVLEHWVPTGIGVFALGDIGRVWVEGVESSKLHAAGGGGMWLSFFEERNMVTLSIASGAEGTRWYLRTGVTF
jgi:hypothetical protein